MTHQLDVHADLLNYVLRLTQHKNLVMSFHLVGVTEATDNMSKKEGKQLLHKT